MEKEQKKLLLVAVSVGVFLLVTITVAIIMLTPKVNPGQTAFSSSQPVYSGRVQPADSVNAPAPPVITNSQDTNININREDSAAVSTAAAAAGRNNGEHLTIQIPRPTTAAVPDNPDITPSSAPRPATAAVPAKPAAKPASAAQSLTSPRTSTARQTTPARSTNDYWIQTGAYSAIVRAEDVKELLASKGLTSIIETRVVEGRNLYRVRLGPYTSENEANHWLRIVKLIDGFSDSQVRQTVRQQ